MKEKIVKVVFQMSPKEDVIAWENHVDEIVNGIESGERSLLNVYIKNHMPIEEMDNVVRELCDALDFRLNISLKYYRSNECIVGGYTDMITSATYYIN